MSYTATLCTTVVIALAIYDLVAVSLGGVDVSISRWVQNTAFASPMVAFACGFLAGHFFGYMKPKAEK